MGSSKQLARDFGIYFRVKCFARSHFAKDDGSREELHGKQDQWALLPLEEGAGRCNRSPPPGSCYMLASSKLWLTARPHAPEGLRPRPRAAAHGPACG